MPKRKALSQSLRWQVFSRDSFRCRYCGSQAGEPGVTLHADHVISVADGGTNATDNLVTACQKCNGGKGARSLLNAPGSAEAIAFAEHAAATLKRQADAMSAVMEARNEAKQEIINLLCEAYAVESLRIRDSDIERFVFLMQRHGPELLSDWVNQTAMRGIRVSQCLRYVHGIIRQINRENGSD